MKRRTTTYIFFDHFNNLFLRQTTNNTMYFRNFIAIRETLDLIKRNAQVNNLKTWRLAINSTIIFTVAHTKRLTITF